MSSSPLYDEKYHSDNESGYASADSSQAQLPEIFFSKPHLKYINQQLAHLEPEEILRWSLITLPSLYQETAFGLSGLVTIDLLARIVGSSPASSPVPLIFLDTLHQFPETYALVERVRARYPATPLHVFKPQGATTEAEFATKYGERLWETDEERYDWTAKVEVSARAYATLGVKAVLTGRRRTQGGARGNLDIVEVDDHGVVKVNPLANWTFKQVQSYIKEHDVPYNDLLDRGYKSVGDWHSTQPVREGEDERAGRWKGRDKTECGIHNPRSKYALFLQQQAALEAEKQLSDAFERKAVIA